MKLFKTARVSVSLLVALMLVLTACGAGGNTGTGSTSSTKEASADTSTGTAQSTASEAAAPDPFGKYDPAITVSVGRASNSAYKFADGESFDNNIWNTEYKEKLGINIKNTFIVDETQYDAKVNVIIASGEIPDLMLVTSKQAQMLEDSDLIHDMTGIFDQYGSDMSKRAIKENPKIYEAALMDKKLMGIPMIWSIDFQYNDVWVRTDWLKKLNLPEPKTVGDLFSIAEAFATQDPDGNKKNDTWGIALDKGFPSTNLGAISGWLNMLGAYKGIWIKDASGSNLVYSSIQPEMKTALQKMAELYKKGAIDREFSVKDGGKIAQDVAAEKVGIEIGSFWNPAWPLVDLKKKNADSDWKAYPLLDTPDGKTALSQVNIGIGQFYVVSKNCKNPEAVVKMLNLAFENLYGSNIDEWNKIAQSDKYRDIQTFKYPVISMEPPTYNRDLYDEIQQYIQTKDASKVKIAKDDLENGKRYLEAGDVNGWPNWKIRWDSEAGGMAALKKQIDADSAMYNEFYGIPGPVNVEKFATLDKLENEVFTKIIMNTVSIDEFDKFVDQWKKIGGDACTKEINDWYSANK